MQDILELIKSRRSVRHFGPEQPDGEVVDAVLEAGVWAPSGLNNQPWSFAVIRNAGTREALSQLTKYGRIVREAPVLVAVFLDNDKTYDRTKDCQAIGACIQNMLLYIHSIGLGAVWLGEILKSRDAVAQLVGAPGNLELMGVVALGRPSGEGVHEGKRDPAPDRVFFRE